MPDLTARFLDPGRRFKRAAPTAFHDCTLIDAETLESLIKVGDPNSLKSGDTPIPVRTPFTGKQVNTPEDETFKWFNENERQGGQALRQVLAGGEKLPTLLVEATDAAVAAHVVSPDLRSYPDVGDPDRDVPSGRQDFQDQGNDQIVTAPELANDPQVTKWLIGACDRIAGQCEARTALDALAEIGDKVRQAGLATEIVEIDDVALRRRIFRLVCRFCGERRQYFFAKADKLYRKVGLVPKYE